MIYIIGYFVIGFIGAIVFVSTTENSDARAIGAFAVVVWVAWPIAGSILLLARFFEWVGSL